MHRQGDRLVQDRHLQKIERQTISGVSLRLQEMAANPGVVRSRQGHCTCRFRRHMPSVVMRWEVFDLRACPRMSPDCSVELARTSVTLPRSALRVAVGLFLFVQAVYLLAATCHVRGQNRSITIGSPAPSRASTPSRSSPSFFKIRNWPVHVDATVFSTHSTRPVSRSPWFHLFWRAIG